MLWSFGSCDVVVLEGHMSGIVAILGVLFELVVDLKVEIR